MSAGLRPANETLTPAQIAALKGKTLWLQRWLAGRDPRCRRFSPNGMPTHTGPAREVSTFAKAGLPFSTDFVNGGHEWSVWRVLLKDFLTRSAHTRLGSRRLGATTAASPAREFSDYRKFFQGLGKCSQVSEGRLRASWILCSQTGPSAARCQPPRGGFDLERRDGLDSRRGPRPNPVAPTALKGST